MKHKAFAIRYRKWIILFTVLILIASVIPLLNIRINPDLETYMPETMPSIVNNTKLEEVFGRSEPLLITFEHEDILNPSTLRRIKAVSRELERHDEFGQVLSLFQTRHIYGDQGMMIVEPAVQRIPETEKDRELLRVQLSDNELASGLVVSEDFHHALIMANVIVENKDREIMLLVDSVLSIHGGDERVTVGGQLFLRAEANDRISRDLIVLLPIAILVMLLFLWFSFKELRGMLLPFSVVILSIVFSMALIPLFGWDLSIIGVLIPIMMVAIANNYGVHFIARYQEYNAAHPTMSMEDIVAHTTKYLSKPIILTGLTTMVGIMGLMAHILLPAKQMGVVVALGIGLALILSLTFIPGILSALKKGAPHKDLMKDEKSGWLQKSLDAFGMVNTVSPRLILLFFGVFLIILGSGLTRLRVASDFNNVLPANNSFNKNIRIVDEHFGGAKTIQVAFSGDMKDPDILMDMDQYAGEIEKINGVKRVTSLASVIRLMSQSIYSPGEEGYDRIPDSRAGVAQLLELYNMSGDPEDFSQIVDFPYENALLTVQFQGDGLSRINGIEDRITELTSEDPHVAAIAGFSLVEKELCESIAKGQVASLIFAIVAILLLLILIFRNWSAGWIGIIPLLYALIATFGLMGWLNIELDIVTALLSSVSIGLGVDYTIHLFWRLKDEVENGQTLTVAIRHSVSATGRAISVNAFAVMLGFAVLFVSVFPLVRIFGGLIIVSLLFCLLCALLLVPSVLMIIKPSFLRK